MINTNNFHERKVSTRRYKGKLYFQFNIPVKWGNKYILSQLTNIMKLEDIDERKAAKKIRVKVLIREDGDLIIRPRCRISEDQKRLILND